MGRRTPHTRTILSCRSPSACTHPLDRTYVDRPTAVATIAHHLSWWIAVLVVIAATLSPSTPTANPSQTSAPSCNQVLAGATGSGDVPGSVDAMFSLCVEPPTASLGHTLVHTLLAPRWCNIAPLMLIARERNEPRTGPGVAQQESTGSSSNESCDRHHPPSGTPVEVSDVR